MAEAGVRAETAMVSVVDERTERTFGARVGSEEGEEGEGKREGERDGGDEVGVRATRGSGAEEGGETVLMGRGGDVEGRLSREAEGLGRAVEAEGEDEETVVEKAGRGRFSHSEYLQGKSNFNLKNYIYEIYISQEFLYF